MRYGTPVKMCQQGDRLAIQAKILMQSRFPVPFQPIKHE